MSPKHPRAWRRVLRLGACACLLAAAGTATAVADGMPGADLEAAAHALQFLESLPHHASLALGIVYAGDRAAAEDAARRFAALPGPNSSSLAPVPVAVDELERFDGPLDLLFLMPGVSAHAEPVIRAVHARRLVSISGDPACLDHHCCVLMVHSGERMEIVLDTALAEAAGARFSTVFTMMVKRR